jgi:hypothetical protein
MSGIYTAPTLLDVVNNLGQRLMDPTHVRWTQPELILYVQETLRCWNALTGSFRDTGVFNTTANEAFYDLPTELPGLRGYNVTGSDVVNFIEYSLQEPPSGYGSWVGSDQFTLANIVLEIEGRRDQFLQETGCVITHHQIPIAPTPDGRIALPEEIMMVRRAAWIAVDGTVTPLYKADEWAANSYKTTWVQRPARPPQNYSLAVSQPLYLQLVPAPSDTGVLDLLTVDRGPTVDASSPTAVQKPGSPNMRTNERMD